MEKISSLETTDKIVQWQTEKEIVDTITDRLGLKIDEGIKDAVIVLHLLNINTTASHEGKLHRYPVPYIDIESPEAGKLNEERSQKIEELKSDEEKEICKQVRLLWNEIQITGDEGIEKKLRDEVAALEQELRRFKFPKSDEITKLGEKMRSENIIEQQKIENLLQSFYENRIVSEEIRLTLEVRGFGSVRLQSEGREVQEKETDEVKKIERLHRFQGEMNAFTEFLKNKFFEV